VSEALTFNEERWLAVITALGVALGVAAGIAGGFIVSGRQTRTAFEHERELAAQQHQRERRLDRERFMIVEQLAVYRRLVATAGPALTGALFAAGKGETNPPPPEVVKAGEANAPWSAALNENELIGADNVRAVAQEIEIERKNYLHAEVWADQLYGEAFTRNDALLAKLVDACGADMVGGEG